MTRRRGVHLWVWWVLVVWAISFPWSGRTSRPQWNRVHSVPFTDPADRPRDVIANIMLFVPFGFSYGRRGAWWKAVGIAAIVSVIAEATQLFSTSRFSLGDRCHGCNRGHRLRRTYDVSPAPNRRAGPPGYQRGRLTQPSGVFDRPSHRHATRSCLRASTPAATPWLRARHHSDAGSRYRRQHRHFQRGSRRHSQAAAVSGTHPAGLHPQSVSGAWVRPVRGLRAGVPGISRAQPELRRRRRVPGRRSEPGHPGSASPCRVRRDHIGTHAGAWRGATPRPSVLTRRYASRR